MKLTGTNKDFYAMWSASKQEYSIYKNGRFLIKAFRVRGSQKLYQLIIDTQSIVCYSIFNLRGENHE